MRWNVEPDCLLLGLSASCSAVQSTASRGLRRTSEEVGWQASYKARKNSQTRRSKPTSVLLQKAQGSSSDSTRGAVENLIGLRLSPLSTNEA